MNQIYDSKSIAIFRSIQFWYIKSVCSNRSGPIYVSELDAAHRGIHIWCIKSVCSNWSGPIYVSELDSASDRVLTFAHEHFFLRKERMLRRSSALNPMA